MNEQASRFSAAEEKNVKAKQSRVTLTHRRKNGENHTQARNLFLVELFGEQPVEK